MLTDKQRQKIISKLSSEMSDSEIADKCSVSRSTVWRIRQDEAARETKRKRSLARMKAKEKRAQAEKPAKSPPRPVKATLGKERIERTPLTVESQGTTPAEVRLGAPTVPETQPEVPVMPKVDVEPVIMANYFAVQILRGESVKDVAYAVMKAAEGARVLFRKLQILDCISVGTTAFARFRSDLGDIALILKDSGRGYIAFADGCYRVTFTDGRQVKYPTTVICSVQKAGFGNVFAGTKLIRWAQQFNRAN